MKLRHAAALALVGWYLMTPPMNPAARSLDVKAPISEWNVFGSYDRATECSADRTEQLDFWSEDKFAPSEQETRVATLPSLQYSECIATDDPRLKEPSQR